MLANISTDQVISILKENDLRVTYQRIIIYKELYGSKEHPTAEIIYERLKKDHPMLSLGTVYKTLDCFYKAVLVRKLNVNDDFIHYDADMSIHTHIIQKNTNQIIDFHDEELNRILNDYFNNKKINNYKITDFELNLFAEVLN